MNGQTEADEESSADYKSGHRCGSVVGTFHAFLETLHWSLDSSNWGEPTGDWQWGFVDAYEARSGKHIVERM